MHTHNYVTPNNDDDDDDHKAKMTWGQDDSWGNGKHGSNKVCINQKMECMI